MTYTRTAGHRSATAAVLAVGGGALAVATWISGNPPLAIGLVVFYAVAGGVAYWWAGRDSDLGAIMRSGGDERERSIDRDATALSGLAMALAAVIGAIVSVARHGGDPGQFGIICLVGGVAYAVSLVVLKRKT